MTFLCWSHMITKRSYDFDCLSRPRSLPRTSTGNWTTNIYRVFSRPGGLNASPGTDTELACRRAKVGGPGITPLCTNWTPEVCKMIAFWALAHGFGAIALHTVGVQVSGTAPSYRTRQTGHLSIQPPYRQSNYMGPVHGLR